MDWFLIVSFGAIIIAIVMAVGLAVKCQDQAKELNAMYQDLTAARLEANKFSNLTNWYAEASANMRNFIIEHKLWPDYKAYAVQPPTVLFDDPTILVPMTDPRVDDAPIEQAVQVAEVLPVPNTEHIASIKLA